MRIRRSSQNALIISVLFVLIGAVTQLLQANLPENVLGVSTRMTSTPTTSPTLQFVPVVKVTDGDTIKVDLNGKSETVRVVGINTPETVDPRRSPQCFGKEASAQMKLIVTGKSVRLEADATQSDRDKYGRLLRFIFLEDGTDVGLTLIRDGYAHEAMYSTVPHKYRESYVRAQAEAQKLHKGLWSEDGCQVSN